MLLCKIVSSAIAHKPSRSTCLDRIVLGPGLLRRIRDTPLPREADERVGPGRDVVHFTKQCHEERRLSRTGGPDDQVDLAPLEE